MTPALDRDLRDSGQPVQRDHVAHHEDLRMPRQGQVRLDLDAPRTVQAGAGLLREQRTEGARLDAGSPDLADGLDPATLPQSILDLDAGAVDPHDLGAQLDLHPDPVQPGLCLGAQPVTERAQQHRSRVKQDHPRVPGVDTPELVAQRAVRELGNLARHLHSGRSGAHNHESHQPASLILVGGQLGQLEAAEDAPPQLEGIVDALHPRRKTRELVVTEIRLACPRGDDE